MIISDFSLMRNLYDLLLKKGIIIDHIDFYDTLVTAVPYVPTIDEALKDLSKWHNFLMDEIATHEMKSIFDESDERIIYKKLSPGIEALVQRIPKNKYSDIKTAILEILTVKLSCENLKHNSVKYDKEKYQANFIDFTDYIAKINSNQKLDSDAMKQVLFAYIYFAFTMKIPTHQFG